MVLSTKQHVALPQSSAAGTYVETVQQPIRQC